MTTRMLIDARHREETRVAVIKGNRIEEFDFESAEHKQLKGNIYLAKVTRVEPSLQAAFVDYGGNRHGFLAFSEIHPDYYQIPKEDREALLREEAEYAAQNAAMRAEEDLDELEGEIEDVQPPARLDDDYDDLDDGQDDASDSNDHGGDRHDDGDDDGYDRVRDEQDDDGQDRGDDGLDDGGLDNGGLDDGERAQGDAAGGENAEGNRDGRPGQKGRRRGRSRDGGRDSGGRDSGRERSDRGDRDEQIDFRRSLHRRYKIQDVIRRRQVLLVQVVKEERGTKGAALTSYLSLAGRYCVLMPNSSHGGGISRKISNNSDRKRLKSIIDDLALPPSMGCIVRTAGLERTKPEIKRDFDYLARLWDGIRETTLGSSAPALIHSDSDLIKRAIRDIYNSEIDEVSVEGEEGYRAAKDFMKLLMPSHARKVQQYADPVSLFQRYGVEDQLGAMYQPVVGLKSGGYLVINPTEALVSIDINSGRATREHNIEQTALNTNLEAAYEIARQLRLRDMAGLVVIDFIDMEVNGNVRKVERAMKDALKNDRARIQVGRISGFGLMEMSRQRLRTGVLEASTRACPHCEGTGLVRTASSAGLSALRLLEEEAARGRGSRLVLRASQEASFYVLNNKRAELSAIEARYGVTIIVQSDGETEGARMSVEASGPPPANLPNYAPIIDEDDDVIVDEDVTEDEEEEGDEERGERSDRNDGERGERGDKSRRRRGRRRRGGRREDGEQRPAGDDSAPRADDAGDNGDDDADQDTGEGETPTGEPRETAETADEAAAAGRRRRRGRRGGRNRRSDGGSEGGNDAALDAGDAVSNDDVTAGEQDGDVVAAAVEAPQADASTEVAPAAEEKPKRRRRKAADVETATADAPPAEAAAADAEAAPAKPKRSRKPKAEAASEAAPAETAAETAEPVADAEAPAKPKRSRKPKAAVAEDVAAEVAVIDAVEQPAQAEPAAAMVATAEPAMVADVATTDQSDSDDAGHTGEPGDAASDGDDTPAGDKRRGWWQRTFGA